MKYTIDDFTIEELLGITDDEIYDYDIEDADALNEADGEDEGASEDEELMSEDDLKIESLKIATNIAKLMQDVIPEDVIAVADKVAEFVRRH